MPNLFDSLTGAQTTGTWTKLTAAGPNTSGGYLGTVAFTTEDPGDYLYRYDVVSAGVTSSATVTVNYKGAKVARTYDECSTSLSIIGTNVLPFRVEFTDDSRADCEALVASPVNSLTAPSEWGAGTFSGDLWYRFTVPAKSTSYEVVVTIDGYAYQDDGIYSPAIEMYVGSDCLLPDDSFAAISSTSKSVGGSVIIPANTATTVRFRIASYSGNEGKFNVIVQADC